MVTEKYGTSEGDTFQKLEEEVASLERTGKKLVEERVLETSSPVFETLNELPARCEALSEQVRFSQW